MAKKPGKKPEMCRCGSEMTYYTHARSWRCNQTGQLSRNCNQVPRLEPVEEVLDD